MKKLLLFVFVISAFRGSAQQIRQPSVSVHWADSVFKKLSRKQKIAQLMVVRLSGKKGKEVVFFNKEVTKDIEKFNIGSICLFQGSANQQAAMVNQLQAKAKTPLLVCIDGETGVGMRFDDVTSFPDQLTIGAGQDAALAYKIGKAIAKQCKRAGIQVDYAPVVDINNNPANPVINFRSFGEDKYKVALLGTSIMHGMQDAGIMACAKHFPGHGDVSVDSHLDLPVINKSLIQLDSLELYPFKQMIAQGVGSIMVAHLYIPAIDTMHNQATSLSRNNVTGLLREQLNFKGLTFTDALEMKGVSKFYPQGESAVQALIAGNDMLCLPGDIKVSIKKVRKAIRNNKLSWKDIDDKVRKVLLVKYNLGLDTLKPIATTSLTQDLNTDVNALKKEVYENAITLLRQSDAELLPLVGSEKVAYVGIGIKEENHFANLLKQVYNADCYYFDYDADSAKATELICRLKSKYDAVIIGVHHYFKYPVHNFGISEAAINVMHQIQKNNNTITFVFGNPYAIKNISDAKNIVACFEDDSLMHDVALGLLRGTIIPKGKLPVTISNVFKYGSGITAKYSLPIIQPKVESLSGKNIR